MYWFWCTAILDGRELTIIAQLLGISDAFLKFLSIFRMVGLSLLDAGEGTV